MHCIPSWEALRSELGHHDVILCLGNGPSSEDSRIDAVEFDCLFRVNWTWAQRSRCADPDLVFTADPDLPPPATNPIVCFPAREDANRILAGYRQSRRTACKSYFVFTEIEPTGREGGLPYRPTNGALMIAAAVRLRPSRLIIAGVDLYLHPDGKYPGVSDEPNDYDAIHRRDVDLAFIRDALNRYEGRIEILSEQLRLALESHSC